MGENRRREGDDRVGAREVTDPTRMHADQVATDVALVRRLLTAQFPDWAALEIDPVASQGTDHAIYRLGDRFCVRLPIIGWATAQAATEGEWLPRLAPHLPLALPVQVARGMPTSDYPFAWSVCTWLPGDSALGTPIDRDRAATDLAAWISALRGVGTTGAHPRAPGARGGPLDEGDVDVRRCTAELGTRVDGTAVLRSWQESLEADVWAGEDVWVHGDLLPGNLLVVDGRLSAVIDFGGLNVGDPACDLQPAWNLFEGGSRTRFRSELAVDDGQWMRGRGWVLRQAVMVLPYYWDSHPGIVAQAQHALAQVLADVSGRPGASV